MGAMIKNIIAFIFMIMTRSALAENQGKGCHCALYIKDTSWVPKYQVMSLTNDYEVDCSNPTKASSDCKRYCADEISALNALHESDSGILDDYPPSQNLGCGSTPLYTVSFARTCGSGSLDLASTEAGPSVCCDPITNNIVWCGPNHLFNDLVNLEMNMIEGRDLDLGVDPNDVSQNEIDDSPVTEIPDKLEKTKVKRPVASYGSSSWVQRIMKFIGYKSINEAVKSIDIFSLPGKVKYAVQKYQDELAMGRCYMEFTTFKVFTKEESPFEGLLRKKRDVNQAPEYSEQVNTEDVDPSSQLRSLEDLVVGLAGMFETTETGRQYSGIINSLLPMVMQTFAAQQAGPSGPSPGGASPLSMLIKYAGPLLLKMGNSRPPISTPVSSAPANAIPSYNTKYPSPSAGPSPMSSMMMNLLGSAVAEMFKPPRAQPGAIPLASRPTTPRPSVGSPTRPRPQLGNAGFPGLGSMFSLLMNSFARPPPHAAKPAVTPVITNKVDKEPPKTKKKDQELKDMILELLRPVFISILGSAPGESGVQAIRRMSSLSTLGRVDDNQIEEVDSPLYCFKRYVVNKAWSVTENGVNALLVTFSPEEKSQVARMLA